MGEPELGGREPQPAAGGASDEGRLSSEAAAAAAERERDEDVGLEMKVLEALEVYSPGLLNGVHRHVILYGIAQYLQERVGEEFSSARVLQLLERFYTLERLPEPEDNVDFEDEVEFELPSHLLPD